MIFGCFVVELHSGDADSRVFCEDVTLSLGCFVFDGGFLFLFDVRVFRKVRVPKKAFLGSVEDCWLLVFLGKLRIWDEFGWIDVFEVIDAMLWRIFA